MSQTAYYMNAGRVSEHHKENARKARSLKRTPSRLGSYGVDADNTIPSLPTIDPYGLLMVAVLAKACEDYVNGDMRTALEALEWLFVDGLVYLEALDIDIDIKAWVCDAGNMEIDFNIMR